MTSTFPWWVALALIGVLLLVWSQYRWERRFKEWMKKCDEEDRAKALERLGLTRSARPESNDG